MKSLSYPGQIVKSLTIVIFLVVSGCSLNPVSGKKEFSLMSEQQEIALGAEADPQIIAQFGLYDNSTFQNFISTRGKEIAALSHRPNLNYQFRVLDSPVVNAFAVPGGYVYFTRGIMAYFNNEAQFEGVLAHEIGHIAARHSAEQYTNQTVGQVLLIGGMVVSKEIRAFANEAQTAMQLLFLKYSRNHETEADKLGVEYSTKAGFDAHHMADFFKTLKSLSEESGSEIPTFLSTHPDPGNRYKEVGELTDEWQAQVPKTTFKVNRDSYLAMIDGVIYGEDPRQGYVQSGVFYHPDLKFSFPFTSDWQLANSPTQVQIAPSNGKALIIFTLAQGSSLQDAASTTSAELSLTVISSRQTTINGNQAIEVMAEQVSQDPSTGEEVKINVKSMYIKYGTNIYVFHGVSGSADFQNYVSHFDKSMFGFKQLTDQSKINVSPERIKIVAVKQSGSLASVFTSFGMPSARHKELAILNGLELSGNVEAGKKIKILDKLSKSTTTP
jgi:predicted Zn-dependent protease